MIVRHKKSGNRYDIDSRAWGRTYALGTQVVPKTQGPFHRKREQTRPIKLANYVREQDQ